VIISIASALLLSRGGTPGAADKAFFEQLGRHPAALTAVAVLMFLFALVPGLPFMPFLAGALGLGAAAVFVRRRMDQAARTPEPDTQPAESVERSIGDQMELDEIHVEFAPDLIRMAMDPATGLDARIANMRSHIATMFGLIIPEIRLTDNAALPRGTYAIRIQGVEQARDLLQPDQVLVLLADAADPGTDTVREPVYGAPARWIAREHQEDAALEGLTVVTPVEVLATHLLEVLKRNFGRLLSFRSLRRILDEFTNLSDPDRAAMNRRLLEELVPDKVPFELLQSVLRLLLEEQVSIRNLPLILEAIAEARPRFSAVEDMAEYVRQRLGFQIIAGFRRADGTLPLIRLAPEWEALFQEYTIAGEGGQQDIALPPDEFNRLAGAVAERISQAGESGTYPAVVTTTRRRRFLRTVLNAKGILNPVLSFDEIGTTARPALVGVA
ncbi:MAG: FHIPEP family type III secretion protein, partial [Rhodobacteraceae bacterium]|nr:FHIPEP family type III secretion protein [Paracoccaceae bacterium]